MVSLNVFLFYGLFFLCFRSRRVNVLSENGKKSWPKNAAKRQRKKPNELHKFVKCCGAAKSATKSVNCRNTK